MTLGCFRLFLWCNNHSHYKMFGRLWNYGRDELKVSRGQKQVETSARLLKEPSVGVFKSHFRELGGGGLFPLRSHLKFLPQLLVPVVLL